jgi:hypothetical protein
VEVPAHWHQQRLSKQPETGAGYPRLKIIAKLAGALDVELCKDTNGIRYTRRSGLSV